MLAEWEKAAPNRVVSIFKSMQNISRSHMLDTDIYDFASMTLAAANEPGELDTAFDPPADLTPDPIYS
jgi:tRNA 2-thiocytidine biosynthesis protein TtcA